MIARPPLRRAAPAIAAGLALAGLVAVRMAWAELDLAAARQQMGAWESDSPALASLERVRDSLETALSRDARLAEAHELLTVLARYDTRLALDEGSHAARALLLRPSSPYAWALFAQAGYRRGDTGPAFQQALIQAASLGPYEPEVQRQVASLGLATWEEAASATRAAVNRALAAGLHRDAEEMLRIAHSRGRLAVACAHGAESQRPQAAWKRFCDSREAT